MPVEDNDCNLTSLLLLGSGPNIPAFKKTMDLVSKEQYFVTVIIGDASECKHTDAFICGVKFSISGYELRFLQSQNKKKKKIHRTRAMSWNHRKYVREVLWCQEKHHCFYIILDMNRFSLLNEQCCWQRWALTSHRETKPLSVYICLEKG